MPRRSPNWARPEGGSRGAERGEDAAAEEVRLVAEAEGADHQRHHARRLAVGLAPFAAGDCSPGGCGGGLHGETPSSTEDLGPGAVRPVSPGHHEGSPPACASRSWGWPRRAAAEWRSQAQLRVTQTSSGVGSTEWDVRTTS